MATLLSMPRMKLWLAALCVLVTCLCAPLAWGANAAAADASDGPKIPPVARVTDLTGTLSPVQQNHIARQLAALQKAKGSQIAVLMVPSTKPWTIEQYGIRVADQWKLGRKKQDDGLIFLIAKQDRRVRLEVGYGLEGIVPDA
ncbi:MAG: TPM domain-containing protein, partial [Sinobacteraceae bacterium]|nr:TPM domain-containing protein [Nevskiaceae bacterium]